MDVELDDPAFSRLCSLIAWYSAIYGFPFCEAHTDLVVRTIKSTLAHQTKELELEAVDVELEVPPFRRWCSASALRFDVKLTPPANRHSDFVNNLSEDLYFETQFAVAHHIVPVVEAFDDVALRRSVSASARFSDVNAFPSFDWHFDRVVGQ